MAMLQVHRGSIVATAERSMRNAAVDAAESPVGGRARRVVQSKGIVLAGGLCKSEEQPFCAQVVHRRSTISMNIKGAPRASRSDF
jgi:hypothetical protein